MSSCITEEALLRTQVIRVAQFYQELFEDKYCTIRFRGRIIPPSTIEFISKVYNEQYKERLIQEKRLDVYDGFYIGAKIYSGGTSYRKGSVSTGLVQAQCFLSEKDAVDYFNNEVKEATARYNTLELSARSHIEQHWKKYNVGKFYQ